MNRKPTFTRTITETEWSLTILGLGLFFGLAVRLLPAFLVSFPINDGGMFAVMMRDLRAENFSLPIHTTYNQAGIPFAYPPFGLYLGAALEALGMNELFLLKWLPAVIAVVTIPAFYFFALAFLDDRPRAVVATSLFALAPGTYAWYLMGGGLTRGLGAVFLLLAFAYTRRALPDSNWRLLIPAVLFCTLTVTTHPQAALLAVTGCAVLAAFAWMNHSRRKTILINSVIIAVGTLLLSLPWWATVMIRHGADVFLSAGQSGDIRASISGIVGSLFMRQTILPFSTLFWLFGLGWCLFKRRFDLMIIVVIPYLLDQRSSSIMPSFIYPLLAAYGFVDGLPALFHWFRQRNWNFPPVEIRFNRPAFSMSLLGIIFYLFVECVFHTAAILPLELPSDARSTMAWIQANIEPEGKFLILTAHPDAMTDPVQEWFPALTGFHSTTTLQGGEWILHDGFLQQWVSLDALQACESATCVLERSEEMQLDFDYVLLNRTKFSTEEFSEMGFQFLFDNGNYVVMKK